MASRSDAADPAPETSSTPDPGDEATWCLRHGAAPFSECAGPVRERVYPEAPNPDDPPHMVEPVWRAHRHCDQHWTQRLTQLRPYLRVQLRDAYAGAPAGALGWTHDGDALGAWVILDNGHDLYARAARLDVVEISRQERAEFIDAQNRILEARAPWALPMFHPRSDITRFEPSFWGGHWCAPRGFDRLRVNPTAEDPLRP